MIWPLSLVGHKWWLPLPPGGLFIQRGVDSAFCQPDDLGQFRVTHPEQPLLRGIGRNA